VRIAGAALWPSLDLSAQGTRERTIPAGGTVAKTFNTFSPQIGASYELDFWGKNRATRAAAQAEAAASRYDRETVELSVMSSVATTYFQALELRERLKVATENLATARQLLNDFELEQQVGTANALDVAQQETVVDTLSAALPPLEEQLTKTVDALAILVGQPPQSVSVTSGTLADLSMPDVRPGLPSELLTRRPDVAAAEAQLISANANVNAARAAFFPQIALTGTGGYASEALSTLFNPGSRVFAVTAGLTQPIFEGGALTGQLALSHARYDELVADYHKAVLSAFGNVEDSLAGVQQTAEQERRQREAVMQARKAYEFAQDEMRAGTVNILTVLNTESALFTAEDALVQVRFSHFEALVSLFNALGGGWQQS
jgi:NodT family efflux transporter outer membrane factor (OMF) lipoprotein